jgi:hypothetical protein
MVDSPTIQAQTSRHVTQTKRDGRDNEEVNRATQWGKETRSVEIERISTISDKPKTESGSQ